MKRMIKISGIRLLNALTILLLVSSLFSGCDKTEQPYRVVLPTCPAPEFPAVTNHVKRVLLEDYTGHTCVNCPRAAVTAANLKEEYGDRLVLMAVHAGGFARAFETGDFTYDFQSTAGTDWDVKFGMSAAGNPNGMVNRRNINNVFVISPDDWGTNVSGMLAEEPLIDMQIINEYTSGEMNFCTNVKTQFLKTIDRNLKLIVALTEDSIVAPQKNTDISVGVVPIIFDYVHMHVLRGTITSTWGSEIATSGISNPESVIKSYKYQFKDYIVPEHCRVVAFVYDVDTDEVLQAAEADLISE
jgi:hypothetical protein